MRNKPPSEPDATEQYGDNIRELYRPKPKPERPAPKIRFKLTRFKDLKPNGRRRYLVKGLIPFPGFTVAYGPAKCGKSFWIVDLAMHVALGWKYRGRRVKQGAVVYCAFEGATGVSDRAEAFRKEFLEAGADPPFYAITVPAILAADRKQLIAEIRAQLGQVVPVLIVLDTLNRSIGGSESSDEDMGAFIKSGDAIIAEFNCSLVIVHHTGLDTSRPRGHTSLVAAADCVLSFKRDNEGNIIVTVEFMKDGPTGAKVAFKLRVVDLYTDEDGDPVTSCVVEPVDDAPGLSEQLKAKLPDSAVAAHRALIEVLLERGKVPERSRYIPDNTQAVMMDEWREHALKRGVSASDNPKSTARAFTRSVERLAKEGWIGQWKDLVWTARQDTVR